MHDARDAEDRRLLEAGEHKLLLAGYFTPCATAASSGSGRARPATRRRSASSSGSGASSGREDVPGALPRRRLEGHRLDAQGVLLRPPGGRSSPRSGIRPRRTPTPSGRPTTTSARCSPSCRSGSARCSTCATGSASSPRRSPTARDQAERRVPGAAQRSREAQGEARCLASSISSTSTRPRTRAASGRARRST